MKRITTLRRFVSALGEALNATPDQLAAAEGWLIDLENCEVKTHIIKLGYKDINVFDIHEHVRLNIWDKFPKRSYVGHSDAKECHNKCHEYFVAKIEELRA